VWIIYIPPNDKEKSREIQRIIMKDVMQKQKNEYFIIEGDFNKMLNIETDRVGSPYNSKIKKLALITWLGKVDFIETYRFCNPKGGKFTWKNSKMQTRIDQIWISKELRAGLQKSDIEEMEFYTNSDHNLIWAQLELTPVLRYKEGQSAGREEIKRKIFLYNEATKENWEEYAIELEKLVKVAFSSNRKQLIEDSNSNREATEQLINDS
jgi:hypothetical protein